MYYDYFLWVPCLIQSCELSPLFPRSNLCCGNSTFPLVQCHVSYVGASGTRFLVIYGLPLYPFYPTTFLSTYISLYFRYLSRRTCGQRRRSCAAGRACSLLARVFGFTLLCFLPTRQQQEQACTYSKWIFSKKPARCRRRLSPWLPACWAAFHHIISSSLSISFSCVAFCVCFCFCLQIGAGNILRTYPELWPLHGLRMCQWLILLVISPSLWRFNNS